MTQARRTVGASISVALWGVMVFSVRLQGPRELALLRDTPARLGRAGRSRQAAGPQLRPLPHGRLGLAWSVPAGVIALKAALGPAVPRHDRRVAAGRGRARLAGGQEHPGHPHVRQPREPGSSPANQPSAGSAGSAPPRPGRASPAVTRPPSVRRAQAAAQCPRRARRPRPSGRHPPAAPADLGRGRDGRTRRDDRAGPGQGAGPLDRRLHRGGAAAHGGRHQHRAADAALRVPRPARHRQDDGSPGAGQDLLRVRPAGHARSDRGAPGQPGRRVPRRHRHQDQRTRRLRAGRSAVHRRGVQPGQRGRRAGRPVRPGGGAGAAQAGRGQPRQPHHHPGRLREADGVVPVLQPRPGLPLRDPAEVPELLPERDDAAGPGRGRAARGEARRGRAAGALPQVRGDRPPPDRRRPGQRPVRPEPDREGRAGPRRARDHQHDELRGAGPAHHPGGRPGAGLRRAHQPAARLRGHADGRGRAGRTRLAGRPGPGQAAGPCHRRAVAGGEDAQPAGAEQPAPGPALRLHRPAGHRQDHGIAHPRPHLRRARAAGQARGDRGAPGRPGGRAPRLDRHQDQQADRLGHGRRAVHRRGLLAEQRRLRGRRRVRRRGGADAAQAGRGRPGPAGHRAGRLPGRHGQVPAQQPRPGVAVQHQGHLPQLQPGRAGGDRRPAGEGG